MAEHLVSAKITGDAKDLIKATDQAEQAFEKVSSKFNKEGSKIKTIADKITSSIKTSFSNILPRNIVETSEKLKGIGLAAQVAFSAGATAVSYFGLKCVQAAAQMEQTNIAFTTMLGSVTKAKDFLNELKDFAANTPFELPQVLQGSRRLMAMGFEASQVIPVMTSLGDAAAGLGLQGDGIDRLTLAIGQMAAKGKVSGEEIRQLAEAGIPAWDMIAKKIGVSIPQAIKMGEDGAISAATGIQAIVSGINSKFGGMMQEQSKTILGMWSNIQDGITRSMTAIGNEIAEGLNLKEVLSSAKAWIEQFTAAIEQSGIKVALQECFPPSLKIAVLSIGAAITTLAAIVTGGLVVAAITAAGVATATVGWVVAGVAAIVTAGYFLWENWDKIVAWWNDMWAGIDLCVNKAVGNIHIALADLVENTVGVFGGLLKIMGKSTDSIKEWSSGLRRAAQQAIDTSKANKKLSENVWYGQPTQGVGDLKAAERKNDNKRKIDPNNLGLKFGEGIGADLKKSAKTTRTGADQLINEINRINEKIVDMRKNSTQLATDFNKFKLDIDFQGLKGYDKIYASIDKEKTDRLDSVNNWLQKFKDAIAEAEKVKISAAKTGDIEVLANAQAMYNERLQAFKNAETKASEIALEINRQTEEKKNADYTKFAAIKEELQRAYNEFDTQGYIQMLSEQNIAFMTQMQEKQALMQQYYDWRMEAEQSYMMVAMQAANMLKDGLASAFSNAIVYGKSLGSALKDLGKQIVAMFIEWQIKRMAASLFAQMMSKKEATTEGAAQASIAPTLAANALNMSIITKGSAAVIGKTAFVAAHVATQALNAFTAFGGGNTGTWQDSAMSQFSGPKFAKGGVVTSATIGLVGEGKYNEAIIPLKPGIFSKLFDFDNAEGGKTIYANQNIYGDINNGSDEESLFDGLNNMLFAAM